MKVNLLSSTNDIDHKKLFDKWPFLTKNQVSKTIQNGSQKQNVNLPLYKKIEMHLKSPQFGTKYGGKVRKDIFQRKLRLVKAFDELREEQRMKD